MASKRASLNGSGNQEIWLDLHYVSYSAAGNYSTWSYEVRYYGNGWGSWTNATQNWSVSGFHAASGTFTIPYSERYKTYTVLHRATFRKSHNSSGYLSPGTLTAHINTNHSSIGDGSVSVGSGTPPRIPKPPSKPSTPVFRSSTPTSISFKISAPSNGGSPISKYNLQASRNSSFTSIARSWTSGSTSQVASPLDPGTKYWIRYRAVNSRGAGPYSNAMVATTPPSTPPLIRVTPSLTGKSATVRLTPPDGSSQISSYKIHRRPLGGSITGYNTTSSTYVVSGLTPGVSYEWRGAAVIGSYQSPWSDWVLVTQPRPNTNPGDYFDGSSPARDDLTFAWTGAPNNSMSQALGAVPAGWARGFDDMLLQRITGGLFGGFSARAIALADNSNLFVIMDTGDAGYAVVSEGGVYVGSIYVNPSRAKTMSLSMYFYDSANGLLDVTVNNSTLAPPEWSRLTVRGTAPAGATRAALLLADAGGGDPDYFLSGESVDIDGAMISLGQLYEYFDGDTPDSIGSSYTWLGLPNQSASQRTDHDIVYVDPLADPDCPPVPSAPLPPRIDDSCIETVESWRRYWAIISEDQVYDWLAVVPTITLTTGEVAARQIRVRFHPNPDSLAPEDASALEFESEQIISYLPPNSQMTLDGVSRRAWATVGTSGELSAGHLLYGADGGPATWPTLECGAAYLISFDVPLDAPVGNLGIDVSLTTRMM